MIVAFVRQTDRDLVMSHGKNLKGSQISLKQNYSPETREKKDELLTLKKSLSSQGMKLRVVERSYRPTLQILGPNNRWSQYEEEYQMFFVAVNYRFVAVNYRFVAVNYCLSLVIYLLYLGCCFWCS